MDTLSKNQKVSIHISSYIIQKVVKKCYQKQRIIRKQQEDCCLYSYIAMQGKIKYKAYVCSHKMIQYSCSFHNKFCMQWCNILATCGFYVLVVDIFTRHSYQESKRRLSMIISSYNQFFSEDCHGNFGPLKKWS